MISQNAINYTFQQLLKVALPDFDTSFFNIEILESGYCVHFGQASITMPRMNDAQWQDFLKGEMKPCFVNNVAETGQIPLFGPEDNPFDIIMPSFAFLSRYEEFFSDEPDAHGRFPYQNSLVQKYNLVEIPIVDEYAMILRRNLCACSPEIFTPSPRKPRVVPTHDIDLLYRFKSRFQALKSIFGRDMLINRDMAMVKQSLLEYRKWKSDDFEDPYIQAIMEFTTREQAAGLEPVFFFKALHDGEDDATYDFRDVRLQRIWAHIDNKQGIVGLHGSYRSADVIGLLREEQERLNEHLARFGRKVTCSRQHYLRSRFYIDEHFLHSLDLWRDAGITDDYTLGFAERCGFRCGTCHPYPLYDVRHDKVTDIIEHPLIVMDGTLFDYMKLSVGDARTLTQRLKQRCLDVEGDFVFLWHNHATTREFEPYFREVYMPLVTCDL